MRVGYDEQAFIAQRRGGVSRYFIALVEQWRAAPEWGVEPVLGFAFAPNEHARTAGMAHGLGPLDRGVADFDVIAAGAAYVANAPARRRLRQVHVLHQTFYHPRFLRKSGRMPVVATVHDMIPDLYPELFHRDPHLHKAEYLRRSDLVLCVSEATRHDLLRLYGDPGVPIRVTPLGVDAAFRPGLPRLQGMPPRYVLYVGRRGAYKDFSVLVEALALARLDGAWLVAVGGGAFTDDENALLRRAGLADCSVQLRVPEADLPNWYAAADLFVFPSRYEGFGLPTIEAMAAGCPTILADASSLPEVGGTAAEYFPAGDAPALATRMTALWEDPPARRRLGERGVERAREFGWAATARSTVEAYRLVAP
jgi:glycosyltransferase involved in cell wall biosynthesis